MQSSIKAIFNFMLKNNCFELITFLSLSIPKPWNFNVERQTKPEDIFLCLGLLSQYICNHFHFNSSISSQFLFTSSYGSTEAEQQRALDLLTQLVWIQSWANEKKERSDLDYLKNIYYFIFKVILNFKSKYTSFLFSVVKTNVSVKQILLVIFKIFYYQLIVY